MKLVADSRGRLTAADLFRPGTAFDASPQPDGSIRIVEMVEKKVSPVRRVKVKMDRQAAIEFIRNRPRKSAKEVLAEARKLRKQCRGTVSMSDILKWTEAPH